MKQFLTGERGSSCTFRESNVSKIQPGSCGTLCPFFVLLRSIATSASWRHHGRAVAFTRPLNFQPSIHFVRMCTPAAAPEQYFAYIQYWSK